MKLTIATIILSLLFGISSYAQGGFHRPKHDAPGVQQEMPEKKFPTKDEIQSQKIAFFTQELDLTPTEAQTFWPVYNACWKNSEAARREINKSLKELNEALKQEPALSDSDIKVLMNKYFRACEEEIKINTQSFEELSKVLPVSKAAKVFSLEEKFRIMLIRHLRR